jgi:DNA-binding transcriptional ArsR family regulator
MTASPSSGRSGPSGPAAVTALDVSVSHSPQHTMYLRLSRSAAGSGNGGPGAPAAMSAATSGAAVLALRPIQAAAAHGYAPDAVVPIVDRPDVPVGEQVAALRDYPERELAAEIAAIRVYTRAWDDVGDQPRRWLTAYADTVSAYWQRLEPRWRAARVAIDREIERIGVAAVRGALPSVLNSLHPCLEFTGDRFRFRGHCDIPLAGRRLILVPSLIDPRAVLIHSDDPRVVSVAYCVTDRYPSATAAPVSGDDRLATVLGGPRAAILRRLRTPLTMGAIADHLAVSPAAATRHCDHLERAGLIVRERRGQTVRVSASTEGEALRDLLG